MFGVKPRLPIDLDYFDNADNLDNTDLNVVDHEGIFERMDYCS